MQCPRCGVFTLPGVRFCSYCGNSFHPAVFESRQKSSVASTQRLIVFTAAITFLISLSFLHLAAALIFSAFLIIICIFWSSQKATYRSKLWFCAASLALICTSQVIESKTIKLNKAERITKEKTAKEENQRKASEAQQAADARFASMSSLEHLSAAKQILTADATETNQLIGLRHLDAVDRPDRAAADSIKVKFLALQRKQQERERIETAKREKDQATIGEAARIVMAKSFENRLLDKGMNVDVTVEGPHHTTMKVRYVIVNKVLAHQLSKDGDMFESLRAQGFKKFIVTDGYDESWSWKL